MFQFWLEGYVSIILLIMVEELEGLNKLKLQANHTSKAINRKVGWEVRHQQYIYKTIR